LKNNLNIELEFLFKYLIINGLQLIFLKLIG
jgi:hypothetical protein